MTPAALPNVLSVDDLAANRAGRLTDHQRTSWVGFEQAWTSGLRLGAAAFGAVGVATLFGLGGGIGNLTDLVMTVGCFTLAAGLAWVSVVPGRRLARDLADGTVETVEGPIERRRTDRTYGGTPRRHFLYVHGRAYQVTRSMYDDAPLMGPVRLYALPRTRKVVSLEPGASRDTGGDAAAPQFVGQGDGRPIEAAIVGSWRGQGMSATFLPDGTARARLPSGVEVDATWLVDDRGGLHVSGFGEDLSAQAVVDGDALEIRMDGLRLPFRREAG
jgi:hypothetical protein